MRKVIAIILMVFVIFSNGMFVYANNIDGMDSTVDISEENQQELFEYAKYHLSEAAGRENADKNDMRFNNAFKIYADMSELLDYDEMSEEIIKNLISEKRYYYCITLNTENETVGIFIEKDEEDDNHWIGVGGELDDKRFDYIESLNALLDKNNVTDANVYLLGGVCGNLRRLAAVCKDDEVQFLIMKGFDEEENMYSTITSDSRLYSYDEIKHIASLFVDMPDHDGGGGSDNYLQYALIAGGAVLAAAVAAGIILVVKKRKAKAAAE